MLLTGQKGKEPGLHQRTWGQEERVPTSQLCHQMKLRMAEYQVTVLAQDLYTGSHLTAQCLQQASSRPSAAYK